MKSSRIKACIAAGVLTASFISGSIVNAVETTSAASYNMDITVNLAGEKKEISPYIYGVNDYGNSDNYRNVTVNALRQGGNRYTGYNWETNYSNAGEDWHNSSDTNIGDDTDGAGSAVRKFSKRSTDYNIPYKMTTLQMAGYVSADKAGSVSDTEKAPSSRWNEVKFRKDGELSLTPDLTDNAVYMDEYVNFIVKTLGDSNTSTGMQGYSLDNEPVLWNDTHPYLHPEEVSNNELVSKSIELASVVKEIDPDADVFGPAFWGVLPCINGSSGENYTDPEWTAVKDQYSWYLDYYLKQMADAEKEYGKRLLDVVDVHYYAQDCSTDDARLQAARSLYDENYTENSWLGQYFSDYLPFLPKINESINKYYPGTKIAVSEYNLGDLSNEKDTGKKVSSAIAETEALGAFADNGVYLATYWGTLSNCPYVESAINLYTNYDGEGAAFGDTLVEASTEDISKATAYAAIDGNDDSGVTVVVSNKDSEKTENAVISLEGTDTNYKSAVVYAITQDSSEIRIIDVQNDLTGNSFTVELPPMSVAQVVVSDKETDKEIYTPPVETTETKEIVYNFSDLKNSVNGYPMIDLGDVEHLKKAVINATASCSSGAAWYCGGGALTFNKLADASGTEFWGSKAFSYSTGTNDCEIIFDGTFTNSDNEEVNADIHDTYTELQTWWASSANDEKGADVSVTYNTITLVYEYEKETTETTVTTVTTEAPETSESTASESVPSTETTIDINVEATLLGDATCDNEIDVRDITLLNQYIVKMSDLTEQGIANSDVIKDNAIDLKDLGQLKKYIIKLIDKF